MKSVWITYAWGDNNDGDIDFCAQELKGAGLEVKLDRWNLLAGQRLWEQIANHITDPTQSDAWLTYATQRSLGSEPCKEEFAYALDRAINSRGESFPVIALFPASVENNLIPPGLRTRLYVSLTDPDWKQRIVSAVEGRTPGDLRERLEPYQVRIHRNPDQAATNRFFAVEMRPRAGTWSPAMVAVPMAEKELVNPFVSIGPSRRWPTPNMVVGGSGVTDDDRYYVSRVDGEATPTQSVYMLCDTLPSQLAFGVWNGAPNYFIEAFGDLVKSAV